MALEWAGLFLIFFIGVVMGKSGSFLNKMVLLFLVLQRQDGGGGD